MATHAPFERTHPDANTIVIFTHGFIGSPRQFEDMAELAYAQGCSVLSILLPGHGGTAREFAKARLHDWEAHLESEIRRVAPAYQNVILVGHSMGGLLSLNASLGEPKVKGVLLISSPLRLRFLPSTLRLGIKLRLFPKSRDEIWKAYRDSNSVQGISIRWLRQVADLRKLMAKTKANLPNITAQTTVIHSQKDETVSHKSANLFKSGLTHANIVPLTDSRHAYYTPTEREVICKALQNLIGG
ncbi:MAG: alpha/beta hydrolase [Oscillospiraceae bacterium]|nr:alpha/beta hydrolase [Oscillospiraceae bacterium]